MNKELDEKLVNKYSKIFKNRHESMVNTCMCWGFECDDGWYWLIDNLCENIQLYIDNNEHLNIDQVVATQVKEKFGGLRFYYTGGDKKIDGMVNQVENMSYNICEKCGSFDDVTQTKGWIKSLCKNCIKS